MKKKITTLMLALLVCVMGISFTACSEKNPSVSAGATVKENTLTVGFDASFPPMGFEDSNGNFIGFDLDLAKEVAKILDLELKLQPIIWDAKDFELESKNIDLIWNGFTMNGREDDYTWTDAYMKNEQAVVVGKDSSYTTLADLADKTVALQSGSTADKALSDKAEFKATLKDVVLAEDNVKALEDLKAGLVDAVVMDKIVADYNIAKQGGEFKVLKETLSQEQYGVGFLKGNTELRDKVQGALEEMATKGTLAEISKEWFGEDITIIGK